MVTPQIRSEEMTDQYGRFVAEPLEHGFGTTLGNALRRVLLSSLQGAAVTSVKIEGIQHEFSTIPHVKEDTIEFLLNVKELRLRALSETPARLHLDRVGEGEVTASDIEPSADYQIVNPELHLATLDSTEARLVVDFQVEQGRGYIPASPGNGLPIGVIPVDAIFSPVRRVNYRVEATRVEQNINYDRLILEVWTDGTKSPDAAVQQSAEILHQQLEFFTRLGRDDKGTRPEPVPVIRRGGRYDMPVEQLRLSVRAINALRRNNISTVGEVLARSDDELMHIRNFGDKSLMELKERLAEEGFDTLQPIGRGAVVDEDEDMDQDMEEDTDENGVEQPLEEAEETQAAT